MANETLPEAHVLRDRLASGALRASELAEALIARIEARDNTELRRVSVGDAPENRGSLVMGAPGKVVRTLDDAARQDLLASAERYRANMRRFRSGLRAL